MDEPLEWAAMPDDAGQKTPVEGIPLSELAKDSNRLRPGHSSGSNGNDNTPIPVEIREALDDTGKFHTTLDGALDEVGTAAPVGAAPREDNGPTVHDLAETLVKIMDNSGGGGGSRGGGPEVKKLLKRGNLVSVVIAIVVAGSSFAAGYAVLKATVAAHGERIDKHESKGMHDGSAKELHGIHNRVNEVEEKVDSVQFWQHEIKEGIDDLKKERVQELKDELREERRRNRRNRARDP